MHLSVPEVSKNFALIEDERNQGVARTCCDQLEGYPKAQRDWIIYQKAIFCPTKEDYAKQRPFVSLGLRCFEYEKYNT